LLDQRVISIAKDLFGQYYKRVPVEEIAPQFTERREFGVGDFDKKIAFRHLSFKSGEELKKYLVANAPPFMNASSAQYERPDARPMEAKGWLGSELIFDLDATDLKLPCQQVHGRQWVCEICLSSVKRETIRLVEDFLVPDFGFSNDEIRINFSGNRGYHVHVSSKDTFTLNSGARRQISEYITGSGLDPEKLFWMQRVEREGGKSYEVLHGPTPSDGGWGGRIAKGLVTALGTGVGTLEEMGMEKEWARKLFKFRTAVMLGVSSGNWDIIMIPKKAEFWKRVVKSMAIKQSDSIDKNVTNDTQHMLRLPNSIHGDTGLAGKQISSVAALSKFEPMKDAIAFRNGTLEVVVQNAQRFTMLDTEFGPYDNRKEELPVSVALYLLLKRVANLP